LRHPEIEAKKGGATNGFFRMTSNAQSDEWFWQKLDGYLADQGLKQTQQRKMVIQYFLGMEKHVSVEELHEFIRRKGHPIGLATVYRTLSLLKEAGLVEQKQFAEGKSVYEVNEPNSHHDHLICISCRKVIEFENDGIEKLQEEVAKEHEFTLVYHSLDLFGYCKRCQKLRTVAK
jgi:Fur family ferric uptake transcriptional regulator